MKKIVFTILIFSFLIGCASVPMAPVDQDQIGKRFIPDPNRATIYVFRNELYGSAIKMDLFMDSRLVAKTGPYTYALIRVPPGIHTLLSTGDKDSRLELYAQAGKIYYVRQELKIGPLFGRAKLYEATQMEGQREVMKCKLLKPLNRNYY